jgi:hypothetical protein
VEVVPRPTAAAVESRAGVGDVEVVLVAPAHAVASARRRQTETRM